MCEEDEYHLPQYKAVSDLMLESFSGRSPRSRSRCRCSTRFVQFDVRYTDRNHVAPRTKRHVPKEIFRIIVNHTDVQRQTKTSIDHEATCGKFGLGMSAREASAFEASKRVLAETTYVDMTSVDLNTLEIASLSLLERNLEFQSGIESHAAVMVFALFGVQSCTSCLNLSSRKVTGKLRDVSLWHANLRMPETCTISMAVSETSQLSHDVFFPCCCKGTECSAQCSDDLPERQSGLYSLSELSRSRT